MAKHISGIEEFQRKLQNFKREKAKKFEVAVTRAGLWLLRESMKIVPVDTSALKNSAPNATRREGTGFDSVMIVGYGTDYAIYVHENTGANFKPGKQAKFLEEPARKGRKHMADIIKKALQ